MDLKMMEQDTSKRVTRVGNFMFIPLAVLVACSVLIRLGMVQSEEAQRLTGFAVLLSAMLIVLVTISWVFLRVQLALHRSAIKRGVKFPS